MASVCRCVGGGASSGRHWILRLKSPGSIGRIVEDGEGEGQSPISWPGNPEGVGGRPLHGIGAGVWP